MLTGYPQVLGFQDLGKLKPGCHLALHQILSAIGKGSGGNDKPFRLNGLPTG